MTEPKPANLPAGSPGAEAVPEPAQVPAGLPVRSRSQCEPWRDFIEQGLQGGLSAQRLYQDLVGEHQFAGGYDAVKRFVRRLQAAGERPFCRMEVEPGVEAQVDFGLGAWVMADGKRRRPHLYRIVLSHSRKGYSEAAWRQTTEGFIRCLENSFRHYGGVPKTLVIDNLRAAVTRAGSCTACWRWPKNIPSRRWKPPRKKPCIMAHGDCVTCVRCWNWPGQRRNWTFWKPIRSSAASTPISIAFLIALPQTPKPSTHQHHEHRQP